MKTMNKKMILISLKKSEQASEFIRCLRKNQVPLYKIRFQPQQIEFHIAYSHLKVVRQIRRKYQVKLTVDYVEPNRVLQKDSRTLIGLICLFVLPFIFSQYLWKLEVQADTIELSDDVMHYLNYDLAIEFPMYRKNFLTDNTLRQQIMEHYRQFSWVHIMKQGSHIVISPQLAPKVNTETKLNDQQHLIASNSGVVTHFDISKGIRQVEPNTTVYKGDTLVSGILSRGDEHYIVGAQGEVYADYWLETSFSIPKGIEMSVLVDSGWKYEWDIQQINKVFEKKSIKPLKSIVKLTPYHLFETKKEQIDEKQFDTLILPLLHEKMLRSLPLKSTIKSEKLLHVYADDDTVKGKVLFLVNENIAQPQPIHQGE